MGDQGALLGLDRAGAASLFPEDADATERLALTVCLDAIEAGALEGDAERLDDLQREMRAREAQGAMRG